MKVFDAILLLGLKLLPDGSPTHELTLRVETAASCFKAGRAPRIICCGGQTPGTPVSEANVMRGMLIALGVPGNAVLCEDRSQITVENFKNARKMLDTPRPSVLIVTSDYHMFRAKAICRISAHMRCRGCKARIPKDETRIARHDEPLHTIDYLLGFQSGRRERPDWYMKLRELEIRYIRQEK
ncbi:MAG: YdcF family protein [Clostridia bacterium]|nr:YdcF family protein [Clostridia bacterium]